MHEAPSNEEEKLKAYIVEENACNIDIKVKRLNDGKFITIGVPVEIFNWEENDFGLNLVTKGHCE